MFEEENRGQKSTLAATRLSPGKKEKKKKKPACWQTISVSSFLKYKYIHIYMEQT